jgi:starch phosphorylase
MLYKTLEKNIAMQFYKKGADGLPRDWIKKMKNSMSQLTPVFNTHRMVQQYTEKFYLNAKKNRINLIKNSWAEAKEFTKWESNLLANWDKIKFVSVNHNGNGEEMKVGDKFNITTEISADGLTNSDFEVQIYFGKLDNVNEANENSFQTMTCVDCNESANNYKYTGSIVCNTTGEFGYTLRILPKHPLLINQFELGAIKWVS